VRHFSDAATCRTKSTFRRNSGGYPRRPTPAC
jgi:hypothetical protein